MGITKINNTAVSSILRINNIATTSISKINNIDLGAGSGIITSGLVNRYIPANYSGTGNFLDEVGSLDITISGATYNSSTPAHFDFDGVNDYGRTGTFTWSPTDISLGWWINADAAGKTQVICGLRGTSSLQGLFHYLKIDGGMNWFWMNSSSQAKQATWTTSFPLNEWVYLTISRTNSTGAINAYLGRASTGMVQVVTNATGNSTSALTARLIYGDISYDFNGSLGEYQHYDTILSTAEWTQNFNATKAYYGL